MYVDPKVVEWAKNHSEKHGEAQIKVKNGQSKKLAPHFQALQPVADEIHRLESFPEPTPKVIYRDRDRIITKKEWWPGVFIGIVVSALLYGALHSVGLVG